MRGCGYLPHVGSHPGTGVYLTLIAFGAMAGNNGGWIGAIIGGAVMAVGMGAIYFSGAYSRAKLSDKISRDGDEHE